jgi:hypothetical protein
VHGNKRGPRKCDLRREEKEEREQREEDNGRERE